MVGTFTCGCLIHCILEYHLSGLLKLENSFNLDVVLSVGSITGISSRLTV